MTGRIIRVVVAATAVLATGALWWAGRDGDRPETSSETVSLTLAGHRLTIPRNALRFADQRAPGERMRLDLALAWPELEGRTAANADRFDVADLAPDVVYVTLAADRGTRDSAGLLATVYARFFTGDAVAGPDGLTGRHMARGSGYDDEVVYFEPGSVHPFVARCWPLGAAQEPAVCLHDERIGAIAVEWRFPIGLLAQWRRLSQGLGERLAAWGLPAT